MVKFLLALFASATAVVPPVLATQNSEVVCKKDDKGQYSCWRNRQQSLREGSYIVINLGN